MLNVSSSIIQIDGLSIGSLIVEYTVLFTQVNRLSDSQVLLLLTRLGTPSSATTVYQEATGVLTDNPAVLSVGVSKSFDGSGGGASCGVVCIGAAVAASVALAAVLVCIGGWVWWRRRSAAESAIGMKHTSSNSRASTKKPKLRKTADGEPAAATTPRGCSIVRVGVENPTPPTASGKPMAPDVRLGGSGRNSISPHRVTVGPLAREPAFLAAGISRFSSDRNGDEFEPEEIVFPVGPRLGISSSNLHRDESRYELGYLSPASEVRRVDSLNPRHSSSPPQLRSVSITIDSDDGDGDEGRGRSSSSIANEDAVEVIVTEEERNFPNRNTSFGTTQQRSPTLDMRRHHPQSPRLRPDAHEPMFQPPGVRRAVSAADVIIPPPNS